MTRILVIGATGFIGLNVVDALREAGYAVRATRRASSPTMFLRARGVEIAPASLEEPAALARAVDGCDGVILAAAHYPRYSTERDAALAYGAAGVRNACDAALAARVPRVVFTSSIATLAPAPDGRAADERDVLSAAPADSVYRAVKWEMEREVERAAARGLDVVTLLPGGCVGPWDARVGTGAIVVGVVRGLIPWWTDGVVNVVDVGDVARAHVAALDRRARGRYCVAGHDVRVGELLARVAARYGGVMPRERVSLDEARRRADADERAAEARRARVPVPRELVDLAASGQRVSSARAERELGVRFAPLDDALDRAHAWFARFHYVPRTSPTRPTTPGSHHDHV